VNILLIDSDMSGQDLAYRASAAGHDVRLWQPKPKTGGKSRDCEGFPGITKVESWKTEMAWAKSGLIVNMFNGPVTAELDRYKGFGFPVFGPSAKSAALEIKREQGMKALQAKGIQVPEYQTFPTLQAAMAYAAKEDRKLVFKTLGDDEDKSMSYVSSGSADMTWRIKSWIQQGLTLKGPCMMQEFIEGIEVGVSGWMGSKGFIGSTWNINFEFKKLMPGDYGPATGEMGTVCKYSSQSKLADTVLKPMEDLLVELKHIGDVDLNCIIDDKGTPWVLEWTTRFGFPSTPILYHCHKGDPVKWMKDCLTGKDTLEVDERTAIGVVMAAPPFPYPDEEHKSEGLLISGIEEQWGNIAPVQMRLAKDQYLSTGSMPCVALALAPDVHDAIPQVYSTIERIKFANRIVRDDIGKRLEKQLPTLHALGYEECPHW
jgi:phosphoribosylamine-glycine ligase